MRLGTNPHFHTSVSEPTASPRLPPIPTPHPASVQATYWVGLFNAAQVPGLNGTWVWADQAQYNGTAVAPSASGGTSTSSGSGSSSSGSSGAGAGGDAGASGAVRWGSGQPPADSAGARWCAYATWLPASSSSGAGSGSSGSGSGGSSGGGGGGGGRWVLVADVCTSSRGVLCQPRSGAS